MLIFYSFVTVQLLPKSISVLIAEHAIPRNSLQQRLALVALKRRACVVTFVTAAPTQRFTFDANASVGIINTTLGIYNRTELLIAPFFDRGKERRFSPLQLSAPLVGPAEVTIRVDWVRLFLQRNRSNFG